ncbi:MAG: FAD:protein FMN transferase [Myxococcota bacterium]
MPRPRPEPPEDPREYRIWLLRRFGLPAVFVFALFAVLWMRQEGDAVGPHETALSGPTMGTSWSVKLVTSGPATEAQEARARAAITTALDAVNASMSTYAPDSELSRFNAAQTTEPVPASAMLLEVLTEAAATTAASGGAFDVTVGPLVRAWGFGADHAATPPDAAALEALRQRVGADKLVLDPVARTVRKTRPDVYVDLSAIAKGYGVDRVALALDALGFVDYMVEVGGEVRTRGHNRSGVPWQLGVEAPVVGERRVHSVVSLSGRSMATSGDYRNFIERDGQRLSHTIDPRVGRPVAHAAASVTVVADTCMTADALATALNVLGPDEGMALAIARGWAVMMLLHDGDGFSARRTPAYEALDGPAAPADP